MKKILLLVFVGILYSLSNALADEVSDCLELEQIRAQREEVPYREAVEISQKICGIKASLGWTTNIAKNLDICIKSERLKAVKEGVAYTESVENAIESCSEQAEFKKKIEREIERQEKKKTNETPILGVDVFYGKKNIKGLGIEFSTFGVLLDYYLTPNFSLTGGYFLSSGEEKINENETIDETYTVKLPYYVTETYDGMEAYTYNGLIKPEVVSRPSQNYYCAFRNSDNTECYDWEYVPFFDIVESNVACSGSRDGYVIIGNKKYCAFFGSSKPNSYLSNCFLDADSKNVDFLNNCIQWTYQVTYGTETRYRPAILTREVVGGYNTETRTRQKVIPNSILSNINIREFSLGGRLHFRINDVKSGFDAFLGAGLVYIGASIEALKLIDSPKQKGSGSGFYIETGIKYIFQSGSSIGYYTRISSDVFELDNSSLGKINWGGTTQGILVGFTF